MWEGGQYSALWGARLRPSPRQKVPESAVAVAAEEREGRYFLHAGWNAAGNAQEQSNWVSRGAKRTSEGRELGEAGTMEQQESNGWAGTDG